MAEGIYINNNYNINKINIDKEKFNLNFLTETLIDNRLIELNNIDLFSYDEFLTSFLNENEKDYRLVLNHIRLVVCL